MIEKDVVIIGAGAAGLMCAIEAGKRSRSVLILEQSNKPGKKILMSGGGRCNFTNLQVGANNFISNNSHFCKSALSRYTPSDFIDLVNKHNISFHEKIHGQLFCDNKSKDILNMLLTECEENSVMIQLNTTVQSIKKINNKSAFQIVANDTTIICKSLVISTGGLSIPTMGSSPFGYKVAEQFNIKVWPTRAGLVPIALHEHDKKLFSELSGVSLFSNTKCDNISFNENILFTHRGLSGPAILQISSYWEPGNQITINTIPNGNIKLEIEDLKLSAPKTKLRSILIKHLPKRVIPALLDARILDCNISELSTLQIKDIIDILHSWKVSPNGTEGYRTAEVTLGGVDCNALSSKTMASLTVPNMYFIGEVVDVTGWLGGYNFQWAWSSGWAAGQIV